MIGNHKLFQFLTLTFLFHKTLNFVRYLASFCRTRTLYFCARKATELKITARGLQKWTPTSFTQNGDTVADSAGPSLTSMQRVSSQDGAPTVTTYKISIARCASMILLPDKEACLEAQRDISAWRRSAAATAF